MDKQLHDATVPEVARYGDDVPEAVLTRQNCVKKNGEAGGNNSPCQHLARARGIQLAEHPKQKEMVTIESIESGKT